MSDLPEAIGRVVGRDDWQPPPAGHGPYMSPVDRFAMLNEPTRRWLEGISEPTARALAKMPDEAITALAQLRKEDLDDIGEFIRFGRSVRTLSRFGRSALVLLIGGFTAAVVFGEKIQVAYRWLIGAAK